MRRGFSLITAIMFIVLVATLGAMALSFSSQTSKQTSDIYLKSQAELLVRSATEFALLAISAHHINAANGCLNRINAVYPNTANPLFDININIRYFGRATASTESKPTLPTAATCNLAADGVQHPDIQRMAMIDVFVSTVNNVATEPIRIHRRTLQKP